MSRLPNDCDEQFEYSQGKQSKVFPQCYENKVPKIKKKKNNVLEPLHKQRSRPAFRSLHLLILYQCCL